MINQQLFDLAKKWDRIFIRSMSDMRSGKPGRIRCALKTVTINNLVSGLASYPDDTSRALAFAQGRQREAEETRLIRKNREQEARRRQRAQAQSMKSNREC